MWGVGLVGGVTGVWLVFVWNGGVVYVGGGVCGMMWCGGEVCDGRLLGLLRFRQWGCMGRVLVGVLGVRLGVMGVRGNGGVLGRLVWVVRDCWVGGVVEGVGVAGVLAVGKAVERWLEKFQQPEFKGYGPKTSKSVSENISNEVRESHDGPFGHKVLVEHNETGIIRSLDCITSEDKGVVSRNNYTRVNYNYSAKKAHPRSSKKEYQVFVDSGAQKDMTMEHVLSLRNSRNLIGVISYLWGGANMRENYGTVVDMKTIVPKESLFLSLLPKATLMNQCYGIGGLGYKLYDLGVQKQSIGCSTNVNTGSLNTNIVSPTVTTAPLEATHVDFFGDETEVDMSNITTTYLIPSTPNTRIN
ncbi:hypothetical protein Tco_0047923 [Tanacetum coccineum]